MSTCDTQGNDFRMPRADRLTIGRLTWFCLPLALTFLMMSGAAPLVSNGITWTYGAAGERVHLSAFLMTFATSLLIYSAMFVARNVAIRTITDRRSMRRFAAFFLSCATGSAVVLASVSQVDALGHFVFGSLLGADGQVEHLARHGLLAFIPIPMLVALRGLGQGCHISNGQSWYVGVGTALRLAAMAVFVFGYAVRHELTGPVLGGCTYLSGITTETLFVLVTLRSKPQWRLARGGQILTWRQLGRYAGPLMLGSMCSVVVTPVLIHLISKGRQPAENAASFNLIRDTGWVMLSMLMTIQPAVVTHATSARNLRTILRFAAGLLALITAVVMLMALTQLQHIVFVRWLDVDNEIIRRLTFSALLWMIPAPVMNLMNLLTGALHTRSGRTGWVTAGSMAGLLALLAAAVSLDLSARDGVVVAVIGQAAFNLIAGAVQAVGLFNGGLRQAISPGTLAEQFNGRLEPARAILAEPDPAVEQVRA